jgi:1,4-dihydroxy-2-naphthoyl-CoA synthase
MPINRETIILEQREHVAIIRGLDLSLEAGLNLERDLATFIYTTQDAKEGPRAFVEKRAAQWKNL